MQEEGWSFLWRRKWNRLFRDLPEPQIAFRNHLEKASLFYCLKLLNISTICAHFQGKAEMGD